MTDRQILQIIGANIRAARTKEGITQECMAELLGIHWQTVSNIERGKNPFSAVTFARLTHLLHVSADALLEGIKPPDAKRVARIKSAKARQRRSRGAVSSSAKKNV